MKLVAKFSRQVVDSVNSVTWFAMDFFWLAQLEWPAYVATGCTLVSGALLLILSRAPGARFSDDLALNAWMWMNACWMLSDLGSIPTMRYVAMVFGGVGAVLLANAVRPSKRHDETFARFRKLRVTRR